MSRQLASGNVAFSRYDKYFLSFSAILATIGKKWLILRVILKSRVFNISICNRNTLIVVKMRGQSAFDDAALSRYGIFSHFQPF